MSGDFISMFHKIFPLSLSLTFLLARLLKILFTSDSRVLNKFLSVYDVKENHGEILNFHDFICFKSINTNFEISTKCFGKFIKK